MRVSTQEEKGVNEDSWQPDMKCEHEREGKFTTWEVDGLAIVSGGVIFIDSSKLTY